ncbi:MAG TPA: hypothetical protein VN643_10340 [Pyrinomonadaceae bacterium]|nr:hypothetical protein [Pyrinomonadaceae bacterium]
MISEDAVDKILGDTFPASDPPSWTLGIEQGTHIGPSEHETEKPGMPDNESKNLQISHD